MKLTRRAKTLLVVVWLLLEVVALFFAAKVGLDRQDRWRCDHGITSACR